MPFVTKPLHIDDPMYVWAAERILRQPLDPYGFDVSWGYDVRPMSAVMKNPPLVSYYLAAVIGLFGTTTLPGFAGFYSDVFGPLPFFFGAVPAENYHIVVVETPARGPSK